MANCPRCGAEIDFLYEWDKVWEGYEFSLDDTGQGQYERIDSETYDIEGEEPEFNCPECDAVVAHSVREAKEILTAKIPGTSENGKRGY